MAASPTIPPEQRGFISRYCKAWLQNYNCVLGRFGPDIMVELVRTMAELGG